MVENKCNSGKLTTRIKSVKHNAIMNGILTISKIIFPLITFPYISRTLLVETNGRINFVSSVASYFTMFAMLGVSTYGVKACAQVRDSKRKLSKVSQELLIINIVAMIISYFALIVAVLFVDRLNSEWILMTIFSFNIILSVAGMEWLYSGLEQYDYITIRSVAFKFLSIILMFIFVHSPEDCYAYAVILVISTAGSNILNLINARKYISFKPIGNYEIKRHIKPTLTMFFTSLSISVYMNLDNVMLGMMKTDYDVGIYYTAFKIKSVLSTLVTSVGTVLLPRLSYYVEDKKSDEYNTLLKKSLSVTLLVSIPMVVYFILYARESVIFIAGSEYIDAVIPMKIIMPILLLTGVSNVIGIQILIPNNKEHIFMKAVMAGATTDLILNAILIPRYASVGAAIATLCAEAVQFSIQLLYARKIFIKICSIKEISKLLICTTIASIGAYIIGNIGNFSEIVTLFMSAVTFGIIYLIGLLVTKVKIVRDLVPFLK